MVARQLAGGCQDAQRNGQVEAARFLGQVRRRQIGRDAPRRHLEAAVLQRGADAVARFLHFRIRQADDRKRGQAIGKVDFDTYLGRLHASQGAAFQDGQTHQTPLWRERGQDQSSA